MRLLLLTMFLTIACGSDDRSSKTHDEPKPTPKPAPTVVVKDEPKPVVEETPNINPEVPKTIQDQSNTQTDTMVKVEPIIEPKPVFNETPIDPVFNCLKEKEELNEVFSLSKCFTPNKSLYTCEHDNIIFATLVLGQTIYKDNMPYLHKEYVILVVLDENYQNPTVLDLLNRDDSSISYTDICQGAGANYFYF